MWCVHLQVDELSQKRIDVSLTHPSLMWTACAPGLIVSGSCSHVAFSASRAPPTRQEAQGLCRIALDSTSD